MRQVDAIYAFVTEDGSNPGHEMIMCLRHQETGEILPMIIYDNRQKLEKYKILAQETANQNGRKVRLVKFSNAEELEEFLPQTQQSAEA